MPPDLDSQAETLRALINEAEKEVAILELDCSELQAEIADFESRYNELVKPLLGQIEAVKSAIDKLKDLKMQQDLGKRVSADDVWRSASQTANSPTEERLRPSKSAEKPDGEKIKQLYRDLARRFHPDLATDAADAERRTQLMALINRAYQEGDLSTLETINKSAPINMLNRNAPVNTEIPLASLLLRRLQSQYEDLSLQIRQLRERQSELRYGSLMNLKLEASLARAKGEDLLTNLAKDLQAEYWGYVQTLDTLRATLKLD